MLRQVALWDFSVAQYHDVFVAVGDSGGILTSPDGLAWTARFSGLFARLTAVSVLAPVGPFVAVGDSGTVATSSDGVTWTALTSGTTANLYSVANDDGGRLGLPGAGGRFGAVGAGGVFLVASNGTN